MLAAGMCALVKPPRIRILHHHWMVAQSGAPRGTSRDKRGPAVSLPTAQSGPRSRRRDCSLRAKELRGAKAPPASFGRRRLPLVRRAIASTQPPARGESRGGVRRARRARGIRRFRGPGVRRGLAQFPADLWGFGHCSAQTLLIAARSPRTSGVPLARVHDR
jgi:hypothetical protein